MTAGVKVYETLIGLAEANKIPKAMGRRYQEMVYPNRVRVNYDPADSKTDPGCSEFIYIYREGVMVAEGFVMPDGTGAWYRVNMEDENERPMVSAEALAGFMFARLLEVLGDYDPDAGSLPDAYAVIGQVRVEALKSNEDGSRTWELVKGGFRSEGDASGWIMAEIRGGVLDGCAYNEVRVR